MYCSRSTWSVDIVRFSVVVARKTCLSNLSWGILDANPTLLLRTQIPRSKAGQDAHVSPTPWVTSQKLTTRRALLRRLAGSGWGAWATTLRTATLTMVLSTAEDCALAWCRSAHTRLIDPVINDAFANCDWMPAPYTSGQSFYPRENPNYWAPSQRATLSLARRSCSLDICSIRLLAIRSVQAHGISNRDTHLYPPHDNSSVYLTKQQKFGAPGGSPMECGVVGEHYETPYFHPRHRHPHSWNGSSRNSMGEV